MKSSPDVFLPMPDPSVYNSKMSLHGSEKTPQGKHILVHLKSFHMKWVEGFQAKWFAANWFNFPGALAFSLCRNFFLVQGHSVACGARAIGGRGVKKINFRHRLKKVRPSAVWKVKKGTIISAQRFKYSNWKFSPINFSVRRIYWKQTHLLNMAILSLWLIYLRRL